MLACNWELAVTCITIMLWVTGSLSVGAMGAHLLNKRDDKAWRKRKEAGDG